MSERWPSERFTDRARQTLRLAEREARGLGHDRVDAGHLLLGLLAEGTGTGANVLRSMGADLGKTRLEVSRLIAPGSGPPGAGKLPLGETAAKALECAARESERLGHNWVGTEHILLGLLGSGENAAVEALAKPGLSADQVRDALMTMLGAGTGGMPAFATRLDDADGIEKMRGFFSPAVIDQFVRQAIQFCWMLLPPDERTVDALEVRMRRIFDRALKDFREDDQAFGHRAAGH